MKKFNLSPSSLSNNFFDSLHGSISALALPQTNYLTTQWSSSVPNFASFQRDDAHQFNSLPVQGGKEDARDRKPLNLSQDGYILLRDKQEAGATLTTWEAYTTCINMYVGMSLLSMGYSLMIGGYMQVISLLGVMLIGNYTGLLMVACFEKFPNPEISYEKLGGYAMSKISPRLKTLGIYMVAVSVTVEFIGVASIAYVFLFRHAYMLFNQWFEFRDVVIVCTAISFPTVFALNFSEMTIWSLVGTIAPICAVLACIGIFLVHNDRLNDHEYTAFNFEGTGISAGIFLFALGGHAALPSVYNSMVRKEDFPFMVRSVFVTMFFLYAAVSLSCLFTFGYDTDILITENYAVWPGGVAITILIVLMIFKILSVIPPVVNVMCEIPENLLHIRHKPNMKRLFRGVGFLFCCTVGWSFRNNLDVLEAITGSSCTMATSVLFPIVFYVAMYWKQLSTTSVILHSLLLLLASFATIWFTYQSVLNIH